MDGQGRNDIVDKWANFGCPITEYCSSTQIWNLPKKSKNMSENRYWPTKTLTFPFLTFFLSFLSSLSFLLDSSSSSFFSFFCFFFFVFESLSSWTFLPEISEKEKYDRVVPLSPSSFKSQSGSRLLGAVQGCPEFNVSSTLTPYCRVTIK